MDSYSLLKVIHLIGVMLITGNFVITRLWKISADKTNDYAIVAFAQRLVIKADYFFTLGGLLILLLGGMLNSYLNGPSFHGTNWILWAYWIFILAMCIWLFLIVPIQKRQKRVLQELKEAKGIPEEYIKLCHKWNFLSLIILLLFLVSISWMVFKPDIDWILSGTFFFH